MALSIRLLMLLFAVIGMVAFLVTLGRSRQHDRRERLRFVETALREGRLQDRERGVLIRELTDGVALPSPRQRRRRALSRLAVIVGSMTIFVGGGLAATGVSYNVEPGVFCLVFGFGVATLPFVMREYDERMG